MTRQQKPATTINHGKLPWPRETLVVDTISERTGLLVGVIEERYKSNGQLAGRQAFMRPQGGGVEWDVPLERIKPVTEADRA
ncbi:MULTISPECIES: hypothetical protein [unclassified Streptomyces]|uniref:hypothetical protein n=1 Tax=unclassified Streptomyces TaxID=2593676 RepID=UPI000DAD809B|nr:MULTISPECIES: hypothetical protein [unclassified Streptomyces]PZT72267.1 hypothetical protein DNK55_27285 [Streptomyces sp. AC1-42T]PZT81411.1 hypothetical protein DNK56_04285 [Streptomyces sp. AC1-42W]WUC94108.1 hypothetical protein OG710_11065 [Streptomyces sp. NBC_00525]